MDKIALPRRLGLYLLLPITFVIGGCAKMHLAQTMMHTNEPNEHMLGQMFAVGGGTAVTGDDGTARIAVTHNSGETIFRPSVITMEEPGRLEMTFTNDNERAHLMVVVPSDGGPQALDLPGTAISIFSTAATANSFGQWSSPKPPGATWTPIRVR